MFRGGFTTIAQPSRISLEEISLKEKITFSCKFDLPRRCLTRSECACDVRWKPKIKDILSPWNCLSIPADKIAKNNTGGGSFCWIGIKYAMPYSQKYTPSHCFFCNFAGWDYLHLIKSLFCAFRTKRSYYRCALLLSSLKHLQFRFRI